MIEKPWWQHLTLKKLFLVWVNLDSDFMVGSEEDLKL
jgi:hypothetical protein